MIVNKTQSYCCDCETLHEAHIVSHNKKIFFEIFCPRESASGKKSVLISSNAHIFLKIREKSQISFDDDPIAETAESGFSWFNILEITDDCNLSCPVCFADSGDGKGSHLSVDEILTMAEHLKKANRKALTLSGGEPTMHPGLFEIIKKTRKMNMDVTMITNALKLGEDKTLARQIKKSGLTYCYLQFDSFEKNVQQKIRGIDSIETKIRAIENASEANINFGTITTVIKDNLNETGDILKFASAFAPNLSVVVYLAAVEAGRFKLTPKDLVDREAIIEALIHSGTVRGLSSDHFWPFPIFAPLGLELHPDCAALLFLAVNNDTIVPLDNYLNIGRLYRFMRKAGGGVSRLRAFLLFAFYFTCSLRIKKIFPLYAMLLGMLFKKGKRSIMVVSIEQFMNETYQDQQRISHCMSRNITKNGEMIPPCIYNHPNPALRLRSGQNSI
ncbi:MAG: radical SAM protein [bacterium]|nr:radical SAM protein [bacterium]